jgi:hypothetical protein
MMGTDPTLAVYLPVLYRVALDSVDELARAGGRTEAARLRSKAARAYARAWDDRCRRALEETIEQAHAAAGTPAPVLTPPASLVAAG